MFKYGIKSITLNWAFPSSFGVKGNGKADRSTSFSPKEHFALAPEQTHSPIIYILLNLVFFI
jgi:hypothetical protein